MPQTAKTKPLESGDVFIRDDLSREYSSESINVANAGASPVFYPPGTPMTASAQTATDAALTGSDSLVLEGVWVPPGGGKVAVIKRPASVVVNANAMPSTVNYPTGIGNPLVTYTYANLTTMLTRLGFVWRNEPVRWEVQNR